MLFGTFLYGDSGEPDDLVALMSQRLQELCRKLLAVSYFGRRGTRTEGRTQVVRTVRYGAVCASLGVEGRGPQAAAAAAAEGAATGAAGAASGAGRERDHQ